MKSAMRFFVLFPCVYLTLALVSNALFGWVVFPFS